MPIILGPALHGVAKLYEEGDDDILGGSSPAGIPGGAVDATYNIAAGAVEFSGTQDREWAWPDFQLPHRIDDSVLPRPHLHLIWPTAVAGGVTSSWRLRANWAPLNGVLAATYGTWAYDETVTIANPNVAGSHKLCVFPAVPVANLTVSTVFNFLLFRAGSTDSDNSMIAVKSLDMHHVMRRIGRSVSST